MKTLKELKEKCSLIAEFKNPAWVGNETKTTFQYRTSNTAALYYDNKGVYYLYKKIDKPEIREYTDKDQAGEALVRFINIIL